MKYQQLDRKIEILLLKSLQFSFKYQLILHEKAICWWSDTEIKCLSTMVFVWPKIFILYMLRYKKFIGTS